MKSGSHDVSYRQMMLSDESFFNRESTDKGRVHRTSEVLQELSDHYEVEMESHESEITGSFVSVD